MDYGAALEMRFGATRRGFESRPLRHTRPAMERPGVRWLLRSSLTHLGVRSLRPLIAAFARTPPRRATGRDPPLAPGDGPHSMNEIVPLPMGEFRFADDEPFAGELGVVMAYAVRHPAGVILFDTGFGFGNAELDAYYRVRARRITAVLADADIAADAITAVVNCHLHVDHAGQNGQFPASPFMSSRPSGRSPIRPTTRSWIGSTRRERTIDRSTATMN